MHHPLHRSLKAAYSFYNVYTQTPLLDLMNDALILAKLVRASLYLESLSSQDVIERETIYWIKLTLFIKAKFFSNNKFFYISYLISPCISPYIFFLG